MPPSLTLVLGGANSGKSAFAERLISGFGLPRLYVATAQAFDTEMEAKIAQHRVSRGSNWTTVEAPLDAAEALREAPAGHAILLDCATLWLSNLMLDDRDPVDEAPALLNAIADCGAPVVVVSNEVGLGIVPDNTLARRFRSAQGQLNQDLAARAELVVAVLAGPPLVLKGQLTEARSC